MGGVETTDNDPILNASGCNYAVGLGKNDSNCLRSPMNPLSQCKTYDPDCTYVKRWIPELRDVPNRDILEWSSKNQRKFSQIGYQFQVSEKVTKMWRDAIKRV